MIWDALTIVTSCRGYSRFLMPWAESILNLTIRPARVVLVTHGNPQDEVAGRAVWRLLTDAGIITLHDHDPRQLDFGVARNRAVAHSTTEWVMHLDCDDQIMPHAIDDAIALSSNADVISLGYERSGDMDQRPKNQRRLYRNGTGLEMLDHSAPCSGVSPFRRSLWEQSPYRTDMKGAWDTALWIGFARLGARFRATRRPCFWYWHHSDSIYTQRRITYNWNHAYTAAQLGSLRRNDCGVSIIVPQDDRPSMHRCEAWKTVRAHLEKNHPDWPIYVGVSRSIAWKKGEAIEHALRQCPSAEIVIIMDADVIVEPEALRYAVHQVKDGVPWFIPHSQVYRLHEEATNIYRKDLTTGVRTLPHASCLTRPPYAGYPGGGIFVVKRFLYEATGGIPRTFEGWGGEDTAIAAILDCLIGKHERGTAPLIHLWHEPQLTKKNCTQNHRRFRQLNIAAHTSVDALWAMLQSLPSPPKQKKIPPWKRRAIERAAQKQIHGVDLASRQAYLGRTRKTGAI